MSETLLWVGPPGTGKTTELAKQARGAANRYGAEAVSICSLTKTAAAQVARENLPLPKANLGTLHSFAYQALGKPEIGDTPRRLREWNAWVGSEGHPYFAISTAAPDVDETGAEGTWGGETQGDLCYGHYQVVRARMQGVDHLSDTDRRFAALWETWLAEHAYLDFTGLLETALEECPTAPGAPSVLFMDEAQDMSYLGMALLRKWGAETDYLGVFGDPLQCLFHWCGTDPDAFTSFGVPARVLSQSYRVPRAIHAYASAWIAPLRRTLEAALGGEIRYAPRDADGEVRRLGGAHYRYPEPALRLAQETLAAGKSVLFLATCSHMLEPLLALLRREGIPFANPWRTKRGDWNPLGERRGTSASERVLAFLRPSAAAWGRGAGAWSAEDLWRWVEVVEAAGVLVRGGKKHTQDLAAEPFATAAPETEPAGIFAPAMWDAALTAATAGNLEWLRERLLAAKRRSLDFPMTVVEKQGALALHTPPRLYVGTVHSVKGAQADQVIFFPDLSRAAMIEWQRPGSGRDGLLRLGYVAFTRARESLILCDQASPLALDLPRAA